MVTRENALDLLHEWVKSESLRKHCLSVAAAMEGYAKKNVEEGKSSGSVGDNSDSPTQNSNQKFSPTSSSLRSDNNNGKSNNKPSQSQNDNNSGNGGGNDSQTMIDKYWITGLLHDFDYEKFPSLEKHPYEGCKVLKEMGYDEDIITDRTYERSSSNAQLKEINAWETFL